MDKKLFGTLKTGEEIFVYKIGKGDVFAEIITFGAAIKRLSVFGVDVVGGFDTLDSYVKDDSHQGGIIGRVTNRIENARFSVNGIVYDVTKNEGENCLHGGCGFDRKAWNTVYCTESSIKLSYVSPHLEEGFPGRVETEVTYTITDNALMIEYSATPDETTPISLTNHAFFNLDGFGGDIKRQFVRILSDRYTETDKRHIPTGKRISVDGSLFDLRDRVEIGRYFSDSFKGYDQNFNLSPEHAPHAVFKKKELALAAEADNQKIKMSVYTDQRGIQFYTGNFLGHGESFSGGIPQIKHGAFCLETQIEPNAVTRGISHYDAGEEYTHNTVYKFERIGG